MATPIIINYKTTTMQDTVMTPGAGYTKHYAHLVFFTQKQKKTLIVWWNLFAITKRSHK